MGSLGRALATGAGYSGRHGADLTTHPRLTDGMGWYGTRLLPRVLDYGGRQQVTMPLRERACAGLTGHLLEIGFGSGLNIAFYPPDVSRVTAVEPSDLAWQLSQARRDEAAMPVERSGLDAQSLPYHDDTFDACLSTWTLCSIQDALLALREVRRVLLSTTVES